MTNQELEEVFRRKREAAMETYRGLLRNIDEKENQIKDWIAKVKREGIVVLDENEIDRVKSNTTLDVYDLLAERCRHWHRPYVKCVSTNWKRIVVVVSGTGVERGLVTQMLISAVPITPKKGWNRSTGMDTVQTPNPIANTGMEKTYAPLSQWTTSRTISLIFEDDAGMTLFKEWKEFCLTNQTNRIILGIQGERHA